MRAITRGERIYFGAVGLLALWVGLWGYFIPDKVDMAIPWLVPPLHARFLGAMYLSGTTFMIGGILSRYYAEVRVMIPAIAIWTGMLFIVSLFYLGEFDYSRTQVWIWFGAYIIYPLIALWLMWKDRASQEKLSGSDLPAWARSYLFDTGHFGHSSSFGTFAGAGIYGQCLALEHHSTVGTNLFSALSRVWYKQLNDQPPGYLGRDPGRCDSDICIRCGCLAGFSDPSCTFLGW